MTAYPAKMSLRTQRIVWLLVLWDLLSVLLALFIAYFFRLRIASDPANLAHFFQKASVLYAPLASLYLSCFYIFDLYSVQLYRFLSKAAIRVVGAVAVSTLAATSLLFFIPEYVIGRTPLFLFSGSFTCLALLGHLSIGSIRIVPHKALIILKDESEPYFEELEQYLRGHVRFDHRYVQKGDSFVAPSGKAVGVRDLISLASTDEVDMIVFSNPISFDLSDFKELLALRCPDKQIHEFSQLYSRVVGKIPVYKIRDLVGYSLASTSVLQASIYPRFKRFTDILLSVILLVLFAPVLLICAVLIKLDSPGPVFFIQERLGYRKKPIRIIKFRTMVKDAEKLTGPVRQGVNDPRITRVGRFLRAAKFDELPQLVNVLKGDLSFIGPRPVRRVFEEECEKKIPLYFLRHLIKPGLTGWAQVKNNMEDQRDERWELERFQYDLWYLTNCSPATDLLIVFRTAKSVLARRLESRSIPVPMALERCGRQAGLGARDSTVAR